MKIIKIFTLSLLLFSCLSQNGIEGTWQIDDSSFFVITSEKLTIYTAERKPKKLIESELSYSIKIEGDQIICTNPKSHAKSFDIAGGKVDRSSYGGGKMVNLDKERVFTYKKEDKTLFLKSPEGATIKAKRKGT